MKCNHYQCLIIYVTMCLILINIKCVEMKNLDENTSKDNILLISFDSLGWKYLDLVKMPVLDSFKKQGVYADYMVNVIPTTTHPNHISLATGLYPESHGIISNDMYDPEFNDYFNVNININETDPKWWWHEGIEPLWYTNERQGGVSGITWWPGYDIQNYTPTYWNKLSYDALPYKERVDLVLSWLKSDKPPNLIMLYFDVLDTVGHQFGFGSHQTLKELKIIDNIIEYLLAQFEQNNLLDKWNIILTSDHGMVNTSKSRLIDITDYVNTSQCTVHGDGVHFVWPKKGMKDIVYKKLKAAHHPNMQVWLKEDFPEKFHYRNNRRVAPILITADEGWLLVNDPKTFKWTQEGSHAYINTLPSMWPIFFARGPAFKKGFHSKTFNSVDLYPLMCKLLKIKPNPNNGSYSTVEPLLVESNGGFLISEILVYVLFFALGTLMCVIAICLRYRKVKRF